MLDRHAGLPQPNLLHEFDLIGLIRAGIPGRMTRTLAAAVLLVSVGCSNAPIAGTLDAVWPARSGGTDTRPPDRSPILPDVRPPGPDVRPPGPTDPPATDALPPPADFVPPSVGPRT
jgi:hypothetical protein